MLLHQDFRKSRLFQKTKTFKLYQNYSAWRICSISRYYENSNISTICAFWIIKIECSERKLSAIERNPFYYSLIAKSDNHESLWHVTVECLYFVFTHFVLFLCLYLLILYLFYLSFLRLRIVLSLGTMLTYLKWWSSLHRHQQLPELQVWIYPGIRISSLHPANI